MIPNKATHILLRKVCCGKFNNCELESSPDIFDELPEELQELDESDENDMHNFVSEGSFVAVYSSEKSIENFYVVKVIEKAVADGDISDAYGHVVQKGAMFIKGQYLEKVKEQRDTLCYKLLNKVVYIHPAEMFLPICCNKQRLYFNNCRLAIPVRFHVEINI